MDQTGILWIKVPSFTMPENFYFFLFLFGLKVTCEFVNGCCRMGMNCFSGTKEAYECLLWSTIGGFQLNCFSVWWTTPLSWADSRWGLCFLPLFMNSFSTNFPHIHILGLMKWISFCCSWKWRTRMRLMPCFTIPEVMLSEGCDSPLSLHYK